MSASLFDALAPEELPPRRVSLARLSAEVAGSVSGLGRVTVEGDVHRPKRSGTGRVWFTLSDRTAAVSVACPPGPGGRPGRFRTVDGERVAVTGALRYWAARGSLHLEAEEVVPVGQSAVAAAVAEARARLGADGLLDRPRRPLPRLPAAIGVVCGAEAAVRADVEAVAADRFPGYPLVFEVTAVSGPGAADGLVRALGVLDAAPEVEVIVLARGGGDAAELLPFSDEALCRAVGACATPVVSAVGHDADRPLCDEVADHRFGTPSIAAAAVVPDLGALEAELAGLLGAAREVLGRRLERAGERLDARARQLDLLAPARVLERGYAALRRADGRPVREAASVTPGEILVAELASGRLRVRVEAVEP